MIIHIIVYLCLIPLARSDPYSQDNNCVFSKCSKEWLTCTYDDECDKVLNFCVLRYQRE